MLLALYGCRTSSGGQHAYVQSLWAEATKISIPTSDAYEKSKYLFFMLIQVHVIHCVYRYTNIHKQEISLCYSTGTGDDSWILLVHYKHTISLISHSKPNKALSLSLSLSLSISVMLNNKNKKKNQSKSWCIVLIIKRYLLTMVYYRKKKHAKTKVKGIKTCLEDMHHFVVQGQHGTVWSPIRSRWPYGATDESAQHRWPSLK